MSGSNVVRMMYAVGSREEHRAQAQKFGVAFSTDFARVLGDGSIAFVILATPHAQQIDAVAGAGKHVFCEKPVGLSMEEVLRRHVIGPFRPCLRGDWLPEHSAHDAFLLPSGD